MSDFNWDDHPVATSSFNWDEHPIDTPAPTKLTPEQQVMKIAGDRGGDKQDTNVSQSMMAQEQAHPDISFKDRFVVKNFAQSPQAGAAYLNQKGFETEIRDGDIYVRKPHEKEFKAVDPKGLDPEDITDLAYDIPAGIATGAASAAGGLAGNIPGAAIAGGATSGGLEALRQKLGQYMGVPQDVSGRDVAISAGLGAASPLVFGSGATAGQIAARALESGLPEEVIAQGQRSALKQLAPKAANLLTGASEPAIHGYANNQDFIDTLTKNGDTGVADYATSLYNKMEGGLQKNKTELGQKINAEISKSGASIPTNDIFKSFDNKISALESNPILSKTPAVQDDIIALRAAKDNLSKGLPEQLSAQDAFAVQQRLREGSQFGANLSGMSPSEKASVMSFRDAYANANQAIGKAVESAPGLKKQYADFLGVEDQANRYFGSPEKVKSTLENFSSNGKTFARKTADDVKGVTNGSVDLRDAAQKFEAYKTFSNPALQPISSGGTTSTTRSLGAAGLGAGIGHFVAGDTGAVLGATAGNALQSPAAVKKLIQFNNLFPTLPNDLKAGAARTVPMTISPWLQMKYLQDQQGEQK